jgi:hypothetical protein
MTDDNIRALAVAADGSLWVATDGGGLLHYRNGRFQSFGPREGLTNEFVIAIAVDRRGDVWAGTNRGLFRRHGEKFERVDELLFPEHRLFPLRAHTGESSRADRPTVGFENGTARRQAARLDGASHQRHRDLMLGSAPTTSKITGDLRDSGRPTQRIDRELIEDHT